MEIPTHLIRGYSIYKHGVLILHVAEILALRSLRKILQVLMSFLIPF
jgi:hypothetical protein